MPNTEAERLGLKEGDQILSVNSTDFLEIEHAKAVRVLKASTEIQMDVRYFPYGYQKTYEVATGDTYGFTGQ
ncbi:UNVERIFIED_CONTAM: hypothetical protein GTU68_012064 [Idotea baltica]|nr:hypothetical protein [Idotea baltica]